MGLLKKTKVVLLFSGRNYKLLITIWLTAGITELINRIFHVDLGSKIIQEDYLGTQ